MECAEVSTVGSNLFKDVSTSGLNRMQISKIQKFFGTPAFLFVTVSSVRHFKKVQVLAACSQKSGQWRQPLRVGVRLTDDTKLRAIGLPFQLIQINGSVPLRNLVDSLSTSMLATANNIGCTPFVCQWPVTQAVLVRSGSLSVDHLLDFCSRSELCRNAITLTSGKRLHLHTIAYVMEP